MRKSVGLAPSFLCLLFTSLMVGGASAGSWVASLPQWSGDAARYEIREFAEFLNRHPWIANKLWEKPSRANDRDFLEDNKELRYWLREHPRVREEFRENARAFMGEVSDFERYGWSGGGYRRGWHEEARGDEFARFDHFLDDHPKIARDLRRDPSLVNNADYLEDHRELWEFLRNHPALREELQQNPPGFMYRERRY